MSPAAQATAAGPGRPVDTARRHHHRRWAALITGTAASLAANVALAQSGAISRVIAGWPGAPWLCLSLSGCCPACSSAFGDTNRTQRLASERGPRAGGCVRCGLLGPARVVAGRAHLALAGWVGGVTPG